MNKENKKKKRSMLRDIIIPTALFLIVLTTFIFMYVNVETIKADPCKLCEERMGGFCAVQGSEVFGSEQGVFDRELSPEEISNLYLGEQE